MPSAWPALKMEPANVSEEEEEEEEMKQLGEKRLEMEEAAEDSDGDGKQGPSEARVTRSRSQQSSRRQSLEDTVAAGKETPGEAGMSSEDGASSLGRDTSRPDLRCPFCERKLPSQDVLLQHLNGHTGERPFTCDICGMGFSWKSNLKRHRMKIHRKSLRANTRPTRSRLGTSMRMASAGNTGTTKTKFASAPTAETPLGAMAAWTSEEANVVVKQMIRNVPEQQKALSPDNSNKAGSTPQGAWNRFVHCPLCGRKYSNQWYLDQHMNSHTGERPFKCTACDMTFRWESNLFRHTRGKHNSHPRSSRPSACAPRATRVATSQTPGHTDIPQTVEVFPQTSLKHDSNNQGSKRLILDHLRRHAPGGHHCNVCGREFSSRWYLDRHVNTHTGTRPFRCPLCAKGFFWECNLKKHLCVHMKESERQSEQTTCDRAQSLDIKPMITNTSVLESKIYTEDSKDGIVSDQLVPHGSLNSKQCSVCPKKFTLIANLKRHMLLHSGIKPFSCLVCGKTFSRKQSLQEHCTIHYKNTNLKLNKKQNLSLKIDPNEDKSAENFEVMESFTGNPSREMVSEIDQCEKIVGKTNKLSQHSTTEVKQNLHDANVSATSCLEQEVTKEKYQCIMCPKQTNSKAAMLAHMQKHMGGNQTQCSICGKKVAKPWNLPRHMLQHTGEKLFQCTVCKKKFGRKEHLHKHKCNHVRGDSSPKFITLQSAIKCNGCMKTFKNENSLQKHQLHCQNGNVSINSGTLLYSEMHKNGKSECAQKPVRYSLQESKSNCRQCHICNKMFSSKWYLNQHLSIHSGDKPLQCKFCPRTFRFKSSYFKHVKYHKKSKQGTLIEKTTMRERKQNNVSAEIINSDVSHNQESKKHECSVCGKHLTSQAALLCHIFRHKGNRDSVCNICNKNLSSPQHLVRHMHIHTGEKRFECVVCKKKFTWKESWKKHIKMHVQKNKLVFHKRKSVDSHERVVKSEVESRENSKLRESLSSDNLKQLVSKKDNYVQSQTITVPKVTKGYPDADCKKFQCRVCYKKFSIRMNFLQHMLAHTREGPFSCTICKKTFFRRATLKIHMKGHSQIINHKTDKLKIKGTGETNLEKQEGKIEAEFKENTSLPKDFQCHKFTQSNRCIVENQTDNSFSMMSIRKSCDSDFLEQEKNSGEQVAHKIDPKQHKRDSVLLETNQKIPAASEGSSEDESPTSQRKETERCIRDQSSEKHPATIHHVDKTNKEESLKDANKSQTCGLCGKVFYQHHKLQRHLMNQSCLGPFECNLCHKMYSYKACLEKHMLLHKEDSTKNSDTSKEIVHSLQPLQEPEVIIIHSRSPSPVEVLQCEPIEMAKNVPLDNQQKFDNKCGEELLQPVVVSGVRRNSNENMVINLVSPEKAASVENINDTARPAVTTRSRIGACELFAAENPKPLVETVASRQSKDKEEVGVTPLATKACGRDIADVDVVSEANQIFECDVCHRRFDSQRALLLHNHVHDDKIESQIKCKLRSVTITNGASKLGHLYIEEGIRKLPEKYANGEGTKYTDRLEISEAFPKEDKTIRNSKHITEERLEKDCMELCCACGERYKSKNLVKHMRVHIGGLSFQCGLCGQMFSKEELLRKHSNKHDEKIEVHFVCHMCEQTLTSPRALTAHAQEHTDRRIFHCRVCEGNFSDALEFQEHLKCHTGEKRFQCNICHKRFALKVNCLKHLNQHKRKGHVAITDADETPRKTPEKQTAIDRHSVLHGENSERMDSKTPTFEESRKKGVLRVGKREQADNSISRTSAEVENYKEKSLALLVDAAITRQMSQERLELGNKTSCITSTANFEFGTLTLGPVTANLSVVRDMTKGATNAKRASPCKGGENHQKKRQEPSDVTLRVAEVLGLKSLEVEIEAIDNHQLKDKQKKKQLPLAEIVISGVTNGERRLDIGGTTNGSTSCAPKTSQRESFVPYSERWGREVIARRIVEMGEAEHSSASEFPENSSKNTVPLPEPLTYAGIMPKNLEVKTTISGSTSVSTKKDINIHGSASQRVNAGVVVAQDKLHVEVIVCDIPEDHRREGSPTDGRLFSESLELEMRRIGNDQSLSINHPRINHRLPADVTISAGRVSKNVLEKEVEIVEDAGGRSFKPLRNTEGKDSVSNTKREIIERIMSRAEITRAPRSENHSNKNHWQPADRTIATEPLRASRPHVDVQRTGASGSSRPVGNSRYKGPEHQATGAMINKSTAVKMYEIVDVESENEESSGPLRAESEWRATEDIPCSRAPPQTQARTEFSRSPLLTRQFLTSVGAEKYTEVISNTNVSKQIGNHAASKAHTTTTSVMQNFPNPQLPFQSRLQMTNIWKEPAMLHLPDCTEHGNGVHNTNHLFAQQSGPWYVAPSSDYRSTTAGYFGWVPQNHPFQTISPSNSLYVTKKPPPYPENDIYKRYTPPAYTDTHLMQLASSHGVAQTTGSCQNVFYNSNQSDVNHYASSEMSNYQPSNPQLGGQNSKTALDLTIYHE